jgi:hypothetical protein
MTAFWFSITEPTLHQGDLLADCSIPDFTELFGVSTGQSNTIDTDQANELQVANATATPTTAAPVTRLEL